MLSSGSNLPLFSAPPASDESSLVDDLGFADLDRLLSEGGVNAYPSSIPTNVPENGLVGYPGGMPTGFAGENSATGDSNRPKRQRRKTPKQQASEDQLFEVGDAASAAAPAVQDDSSNTQEDRTQRSRERNRLHARNSRMRKKIYIDSLKQTIAALQEENAALRSALQGQGSNAESMFPSVVSPDVTSQPPLLAGEGGKAVSMLRSPDFMLIEALSNSTQNFVISDPKLPDNPIVYASENFFDLTGYSRDEVIGRNCRFLQGPETSVETVAEIRDGVAKKKDIQVAIKNYRKDGTTFWNRLFIAPLKNCHGGVVNYIAVQSEVSEEFAMKVQEVIKQGLDGAPLDAKNAFAAAAAMMGRDDEEAGDGDDVAVY